MLSPNSQDDCANYAREQLEDHCVEYIDVEHLGILRSFTNRSRAILHDLSVVTGIDAESIDVRCVT